MAGGSLSLSEKLLVAGAFVALVAMAVGTEDNPGVVAAGGTALGGQAVAVKAATKAERARSWGPTTSGDAPGVRAKTPDSEARSPPPPQFQPDPRLHETETLPPGFGGTPALPEE